MLNKVWVKHVIAGSLAFTASFALAENPDRNQQQVRKTIYGSQLITRQEYAEHRARMRAAKTTGEREQIRKEYHERVRARARIPA